MTREEAIRIFRKEIECLSHTKCSDCRLKGACDPISTTPLDSEYIEAFGMAIEALSAEPCDDCISRQAVLDVIEREMFKGDAISEIEKLPSVTPKPKIGRWIECMPLGAEDWCYKCSECNFWKYKKTIDLSKFKFCPNCGSYNGGHNNVNE